jgi:eukaryotic-like serine/threonine-protein kinase
MAADWHVPGFTEVRELGRGAGGTVVQATDGSGTAVAIKYLSADLMADEAFRVAFRAEARLLAEIGTPHIAQLFEYVESPRGAAIVMELVAGASLRSTLAEHGPTEPESALSVLKGSLLGLEAAHRAGVVHRDYKPENVLITAEGDSKLVDFGVAARAGGAGDGAGTPAYMPPEQWAGGVASPQGDIYAATATFIECLVGQPPYLASDLVTLRDLHEHAPIPEDSLPEPLRDLARRGMAKEPSARPTDAGVFLVELEHAAVAGYGEDWEERGQAGLARRAALLLALLAGAGGALAGTAIASSTLQNGSRGRRPAIFAAAAALIVLGAIVAAGLSLGHEEPPPDVAAVVARPPEPVVAPPTPVVVPPAVPPPVVPVPGVIPTATLDRPVTGKTSERDSSDNDNDNDDDDDDDDGPSHHHHHRHHRDHGDDGGDGPPSSSSAPPSSSSSAPPSSSSSPRPSRSNTPRPSRSNTPRPSRSNTPSLPHGDSPRDGNRGSDN